MALPFLECHIAESPCRHAAVNEALLCERTISPKTQAELDTILPELKAAIRDHIHYLRASVRNTDPHERLSHSIRQLLREELPRGRALSRANIMAARRKSTQFVQSPAVTKCADCGAAILFRLSSLIPNSVKAGLSPARCVCHRRRAQSR